MNKIKIFAVLMLIMLLAGCGEYTDKRIVKLVTVDNKKVSIYYYDFSQENPSYLIEQADNNGIQDTFTQLLSEADYDLKLCRFVICEKSVITDNIAEMFYAVVNSGFSPDTAIMEGDTGEKTEDYIEDLKSDYPLYSYYVDNNKITGIVENTENKERHLIVDNKLYKTLSERQSFVFDVMCKTVNKGSYTFEKDDKLLTAVLENTDVYYTDNNGVMQINIVSVLKSYKGITANKNNKTAMTELLKTNMEKDIMYLYNDTVLAEKFKLNWYKNISGAESIKVNITIK